jgi:hypothetical protein
MFLTIEGFFLALAGLALFFGGVGVVALVRGVSRWMRRSPVPPAARVNERPTGPAADRHAPTVPDAPAFTLPPILW